MKKTNLVKNVNVALVALSCSLFSGLTLAAQSSNSIYFTGSVTQDTCQGEITNPSTGMSASTLSLGAVKPSELGSVKTFSIKLMNETGGECTVPAGSSGIKIAFQGPFTTTGIANNGTATDAFVILKNQGTLIAKGNNSITKTAAEFTGGVEFEAQLQGGTKIGTVNTGLTYTIEYM